MELKYTIGIAPITKKNSQRIVRYGARVSIAPSKQYENYAASAWAYLRPKPPLPIDFPVEVQCKFYMPNKKRVDLTNLLEAVDDVLVKYGILEDDSCNILVSHDGSRVLHDKDRPRTEIVIREVQDAAEN